MLLIGGQSKHLYATAALAFLVSPHLCHIIQPCLCADGSTHGRYDGGDAPILPIHAATLAVSPNLAGQGCLCIDNGKNQQHDMSAINNAVHGLPQHNLKVGLIGGTAMTSNHAEEYR